MMPTPQPSQPPPYYRGGEKPINLPSDYSVASLVATMFKILAILSIIGGLVAADQATNLAQQFGTSISDQRNGILYIFAATSIVASMFAFFGYVLSLLRGIYLNTRQDKNQGRPYPYEH